MRTLLAVTFVTLFATAVRRRLPTAFVTGGYSRMGIGDGEGAFSAFNVGAGAHLWFRDRAGLRLEVRDHIRPDRRGTTHYLSLRAGVAFP